MDPKAFGEYPKRPSKHRDYRRHRQLVEEYLAARSSSKLKQLDQLGIRTTLNVFCRLPNVSIHDLHQPDLLHNIYLGIFKHVMTWVQEFLQKHNRLKHFDDAWKSMPPYPGFKPLNKAYREVTQWQGKEMRNLGRILVPALASALRNPATSERIPFSKALRCVSAIVDFHLMAQYPSHTENTLEWMEKYLKDFHQYKEVFREFRRSKATTEEAREHARDVRETQQQELEDFESLTATQRKHLEKEMRLELQGEIEDVHRGSSHFNFVKMHLITHYQSHVKRFGNIRMYSTEVTEVSHKLYIKDGYHRSNHRDASQQILDRYNSTHIFRNRIQSLTQLAQDGITTSEVQDVLGLYGKSVKNLQGALDIRID
jgi:hypothetical protein